MIQKAELRFCLFLLWAQNREIVFGAKHIREYNKKNVNNQTLYKEINSMR